MDDVPDALTEPALTASEWEESVEEANRVLGPDAADKCTYEQGYRPRQALFACLTCCKDEPAGVCTGCAITCHQDHEVVELWTKRSFRCDCGNSKFSSKCQLQPEKDDLNTQNQYNQNFKGLYCSCHRPFPDPEREAREEEEEDMTQCVVCEDWFHDEHLGECADDYEFEELICPGCYNSKCQFLALYPGVLSTPSPTLPAESQKPVAAASPSAQGAVDLPSASGTAAKENITPPFSVGVGTSESEACKLSSVLQGRSLAAAVGSLLVGDLNSAAVAIRVPKDATEDDDAPQNSDAAQISASIKEEGVHNGDEEGKGTGESPSIPPESVGGGGEDFKEKGVDATAKVLPLFLATGWRSLLCACRDCCSHYAAEGVDFLCREDDTVRVYEEAGTKRAREIEEQQEEELKRKVRSLGHVGQVYFAHGVQQLTSSFGEFLARNGPDKVITADAVRGFFDNLKSKRARRE